MEENERVSTKERGKSWSTQPRVTTTQLMHTSYVEQNLIQWINYRLCSRSRLRLGQLQWNEVRLSTLLWHAAPLFFSVLIVSIDNFIYPANSCRVTFRIFFNESSVQSFPRLLPSETYSSSVLSFLPRLDVRVLRFLFALLKLQSNSIIFLCD